MDMILFYSVGYNLLKLIYFEAQIMPGFLSFIESSVPFYHLLTIPWVLPDILGQKIVQVFLTLSLTQSQNQYVPQAIMVPFSSNWDLELKTQPLGGLLWLGCHCSRALSVARAGELWNVCVCVYKTMSLHPYLQFQSNIPFSSFPTV